MDEIKNIKKRIVPILKKSKVRKAGIFGSFATGQHKKSSDVDILIDLDKSVGLFKFIDLKLKLEKILRRKVDLVEYCTIRPELKSRILAEEIQII